ncbi:hypothetical protein [Aeromicrobium yanjiei]|uniref:Uncharacterized protein n=1 Tax=Aeromicrobium yanjiei TaxID=2662028 RepID=A0A5Q2MFH5_9ACTN|nr:hypothetical protein [Aeromicrobium yanjiei]QGG41388.1 hypothetical protein GEV26_08460 [Aeromicrobium yanjiei]
MARSWVPKGALALLGVTVLLVAVFAIANPSWFDSDDNATAQTFTIPVPIESRLEMPALALRGRTEVAKSSTVKDGEVKVQVRTTGSPDQRRCDLTTELGPLVVLEARTRIKGELNERTHTVRDAVAVLDHHVTVVLPAAARSKAWFEMAARLSAFLTHRGHEFSYTKELPEATGDQVTPEALGADTSDELVVTRDRDVGGCNVRQTPYDVQLLPQPALTIGTDGVGFTAVPRASRLVPTLEEFEG